MDYLRPSFFIIGERKCGTSSLFRYLLEHPQILPGERKEMQFFSKGPSEVAQHFESYLQRFPEKEGQGPSKLRWPELDDKGMLFEEEIEYPREPGIEYITGEASADTFAEVPPELLQSYLPDLRLIVLLREPVARAFSHHRMLRRFQGEGRDLPSPVGDFANDMRSEMTAARAGRGKRSAILSLGCYAETLETWTEAWGHDALLVLFTEDLQDSSTQPNLLQRVRQHLGLSDWPRRSLPMTRYNEAPPETLQSEIQGELYDFYRPHNARLRDYLQCELPWQLDQ